jgi:hypothetical protein
MKRSIFLPLVLSCSLLLGGCWPYWNDGGGHGGGHDHGHYYNGNQGGQNYHRW